MHIDILSVTIRGGLTALRSPIEVAVAAVKDYVENHPYSMLYICRNYSRVLDHLDGDFDVRRAFTAYQLFSILEDVYQDVMFIEHDPLLFEDALGGKNGDENGSGNKDRGRGSRDYSLAENLSLAVKDVARGRLIIYYSPFNDPFFNLIAKNSDRVLIFEREPSGYFIVDSGYSEGYRNRHRRFYHRFLPKGQTTLEVF
ncbi:hypothetical protein DRP07_06650 [Archaeoglobales archaeon]|nr:MAG: hypothetical protein DRP07_06650 [Archaeoglobales archaeon]